MRAKDVITRDILKAANLVTALRPVSLIPLYLLFRWEQDLLQGGQSPTPAVWWLLGVAFIIFISDFFDGVVARRFNQKTAFGQYFDPLCDKLTILVGVILLVVYRNYALWMAVLLYAREFIGVFFGTFLFYRRDIQGRPNWWGKFGIFFIALSFTWFIALPILPQTGWWQQPQYSYVPVVITYVGGLLFYAHRYAGVVFRPEKYSP